MSVDELVGLIGASYNDSGPDIYQQVAEKYSYEVKQLKRKFPGHYILRNSGDMKFNLKSTILLQEFLQLK